MCIGNSVRTREYVYRSLTKKITNNNRIQSRYRNMVNASKFVYAAAFDGEPKQSDFQLQTENLPALSDGGK